MWFEFVMVGLLCAAGFWVLQRRRWTKWIRVPLGLAAFVMIIIVGLYSQRLTLGAEDYWYNQSPWRELLLLVIMLLGMVARYFTHAIEIRRERIRELSSKMKSFEKPSIEFDAWEFSYPLFVSVITFGALLSQLEGNVLNVANIVLSFQTGFFWQTILNAKQPQIAQ